MSRAFINRLFILGALIGATACSNADAPTGPSNPNPDGTHPLVQIDQKVIPFVIFNGPDYNADYDYTGYHPSSPSRAATIRSITFPARR
jgi:hypothetical protein